MSDDLERAEKALLASANEDDCGLYEAIWELNSLFPAMPLGGKYELARGALSSLLKEGLIRLERRTKEAGTYRIEAIEPGAAAAVFDNPTSWYPEYPENVRVGFSVTEKGVKRWEGER